MPIEVDISWGEESAISVPTTAAGGMLIPGGARLTGWSFLETTGAAAASFTITSGGNIIATGAMGAGLATTSHLGDNGVSCPQDITLHVVSGSIQGAVYAKART